MSIEISELNFKLGDIIQIEAIKPDYHLKYFFIEYIDDELIRIVNIENGSKYSLDLDMDGCLIDTTIEKILLLSRSVEEGYARQNGLKLETYIKLVFEDEEEITGKIVNLEEDMIEIEVVDSENIFIDFEYKGIPKTIPLKQIVIVEQPSVQEVNEEKEKKKESSVALSVASSVASSVALSVASMKFSPEGHIIINIPENAPTDSVASTDNYLVNKEEKEEEYFVQRYGINTQLNDLLDELLSTIPDTARTSTVMERVNRIIRRFKELRENFSTFDKNGNVNGFKNFNAAYKPLVDHMNHLDTHLRWIIPVVKEKVKIYSENLISDETVVKSELSKDLQEYKNNLEVYKTTNDYSSFYNGISPIFTPFEKYEGAGILKSDVVKTDLETIVDNLEDYYTHVYKKGDQIAKKRFLIQRYNLGMTKISNKVMRSGKSVYMRENVGKADAVSVKSVIMLPKPVLEFSRVSLPGTNILTRANLSQKWLYHYKMLNKKTGFVKINIDNVNREHNYEADADSKFLQTPLAFDIPNSVNSDYNTILDTVIPRSVAIIRLLKSEYIGYNFYDMLGFFEPFLIYADNITYAGTARDGKNNELYQGKGGPYQELRTHIIKNSKDYEKRLFEQKKKYESLKKFVSADQKKNTVFEHIKLEMQNQIKKKYGIKNEGETATEILNKITELDSGKFYMSLCSLIMSHLYTPDLAKLLDYGKSEVSNSKACLTHVIAKKYTSLSSLQKDNGKEEVFFDKEFDTTPYDILKKYKESQKRQDFLDYFTTVLKKEHGIQQAEEVAKTIIAGKKRVEQNNYAVLIIYPKLKSVFDESSLSKEEKESVEIEADAKKRVYYFKRVQNDWVRDNEMTDSELTNEFFCNSDKNCFYDKNNEICDIVENAATRMKRFAKKNLYETAVELTLGEFRQEIEKMYELKKKQIEKIRLIKEYKVEEFSLRAYHMGNKVVLTDIMVSPYAELRDRVLAHVDFVQRQELIQQFTNKYCRYAIDGESNHWLYCKETNVKLLPIFLFSLAQSFSMDLYEETLDIIISTQGTLSDDGDSIVDKYTGYIICYRDLVAQEEFDDKGFAIKTRDVVKKDNNEIIEDAINAEIEENQLNLSKLGKPKKRVFEDQTNLYIYNVSITISKSIGIDIDEIDDSILSHASRIITNSLYSKEAFESKKQTGKKIVTYESYKNTHIFYITAAVTFIVIQTRIPSFQPKKTFPGCVYSLVGYPLDANKSGLNYICCILEKIKNPASEPWKSVSKLKSEHFMILLEERIEKYILKDSKIQRMLELKRNYLVLHPENEFIPDELNVDKKWSFFQPPLKNSAIEKTVSSVTSAFNYEITESLKTGHSSQHQHIGNIYKKIIEHTYSTVDNINKIISQVGKDALLKAGNIIFLENSCCQEVSVEKPIIYFGEKDENIKKSIEFVQKYGQIYGEIKILSIPAFASSKLKKIEYVSADSDNFSDENIYSAYIHYCKLNTDLPIPDDLQDICPEKLVGLNAMGLEESIQALKDNGKPQTKETLTTLMGKVSRRNQIIISFADEEVPSFDNLLIQDNIDKHIKTAMQTKDHDKLNVFLDNLNKKMQEDFFDYLSRYGNLKRKEIHHLREHEYTGSIVDFVENVAVWSDSKKIQRFIKNTIDNITNVIPTMLENTGMKNTDMSKTKKHWDFAPSHYENLTKSIDNYFEEIKSYTMDEKVCSLFHDISEDIDLKDISLLIPYLATIAPNFDEKTMSKIYKYCYLSVFSKIICESDEPRYTDFEYVSAKKNDWTKRNCDKDDVGEQLDIQDNKQQFFNKVSKMIVVILNTDMNNKKMINFSYSDLSDKFHKEALAEKKKITDKLKGMNDSDRKVENLLKEYKLGDWFVDEGVYIYKKGKYEEEVAEGIIQEDEGFVLEEGDEDRNNNEDN
jgi:hypothetical protein